jgi:hypothetical protein
MSPILSQKDMLHGHHDTKSTPAVETVHLRATVKSNIKKSKTTSAQFTADVSTEGADRKFLFWDVSKEFPISLSVLHRFT